MLSQCTDKAKISWLNEVWKKTYEELADSGEDRIHSFESLIVMGLETKLAQMLEVEYNKRRAPANEEVETVAGRQLIKTVIVSNTRQATS